MLISVIMMRIQHLHNNPVFDVITSSSSIFSVSYTFSSSSSCSTSFLTSFSLTLLLIPPSPFFLSFFTLMPYFHSSSQPLRHCVLSLSLFLSYLPLLLPLSSSNWHFSAPPLLTLHYYPYPALAYTTAPPLLPLNYYSTVSPLGLDHVAALEDELKPLVEALEATKKKLYFPLSATAIGQVTDWLYTTPLLSAMISFLTTTSTIFSFITMIMMMIMLQTKIKMMMKRITITTTTLTIITIITIGWHICGPGWCVAWESVRMLQLRDAAPVPHTQQPTHHTHHAHRG